MDFRNLNEAQKAKLKHYLNSNTWYRISQSGYRNKFSRSKKEYFDLLDLSGNNIHLKLRDIISNKLNDLIKIDEISKGIDYPKSGAYSHISIMRNCTFI